MSNTKPQEKETNQESPKKPVIYTEKNTRRQLCDVAKKYLQMQSL